MLTRSPVNHVKIRFTQLFTIAVSSQHNNTSQIHPLLPIYFLKEPAAHNGNTTTIKSVNKFPIYKIVLCRHPITMEPSAFLAYKITHISTCTTGTAISALKIQHTRSQRGHASTLADNPNRRTCKKWWVMFSPMRWQLAEWPPCHSDVIVGKYIISWQFNKSKFLITAIFCWKKNHHERSDQLFQPILKLLKMVASSNGIFLLAIFVQINNPAHCWMQLHARPLRFLHLSSQWEVILLLGKRAEDKTF